jgi:hypothetical protein
MSSRKLVAWALALDLIFVVVFATIGRASHNESLSVAGIVETAWPFVVGLLVGWLMTRAWRAPARIFPIGVVVWGCTVVIGLALRVASGQGVQLAFVIVATLALALVLLGWRLVARFTVLRSRQHSGVHSPLENAEGASAEGVAQASLEHTWSIAVPLAPPGFYPKFGPLPAVTEVRDQSGAWDAVGQTRTLLLSDGGSVVETITDYRHGEFFGYELTAFQKLFGKLVSGARAEWSFSTVPLGVGTGTRIRWSYKFFPKRGTALIVAAIVALFWAPYMRRVLPGIIAHVESSATVASASN